MRTERDALVRWLALLSTCSLLYFFYYKFILALYFYRFTGLLTCTLSIHYSSFFILYSFAFLFFNGFLFTVHFAFLMHSNSIQVHFCQNLSFKVESNQVLRSIRQKCNKWITRTEKVPVAESRIQRATFCIERSVPRTAQNRRVKKSRSLSALFLPVDPSNRHSTLCDTPLLSAVAPLHCDAASLMRIHIHSANWCISHESKRSPSARDSDYPVVSTVHSIHVFQTSTSTLLDFMEFL